jgi:hypothetical protein
MTSPLEPFQRAYADACSTYLTVRRFSDGTGPGAITLAQASDRHHAVTLRNATQTADDDAAWQAIREKPAATFLSDIQIYMATTQAALAAQRRAHSADK